jgi:hypothetical protein
MSDILLIGAAIAIGSVSVILLLMWIMRLSEKRGHLGQGGDGWGDGGGGGGYGDGGSGDCGGGDGGGSGGGD